MTKEINDFKEIINMIETRRKNVYRKINEELILLYWDFGKYVSIKINNNIWGSKTITRLANFLKDNYPYLKGFNRSGIYRMIQFYETYKDDEFVAPLVRQLSWTNNLLILGGCKTREERIFYIKMSIKNNYTKRELNRQINSAYYERYMLSNGRAISSIDNTFDEDNFPNTKILDTYCLEFLNLNDNFSEKDLRKSIINNLKNFILEIGKSFTFIGEEYKIQVGNEDYFIDLLFYNRELKCLVAFELKIGKFKPEYVSKMNFYLEALDREEKLDNENPSVGIILCSNKDEKVVEYTISRSLSKPLIALYNLKLIDKKLLENKLREIEIMVDENNEFK